MNTQKIGKARSSACSPLLQTQLIRSVIFTRSESHEAAHRVSAVGYVFGESWTNDKMLADLALLRPSCFA
jgi:hypothetical protein